MPPGGGDFIEDLRYKGSQSQVFYMRADFLQLLEE